MRRGYSFTTGGKCEAPAVRPSGALLFHGRRHADTGPGKTHQESVNPTRTVNAMSQKAPGRAVKRELQRAKALELRSLGLSYARIAEALGVRKTRAFNIVRDALDEVQQENRENVERIRTLELYRLDRIRFALWPRRGDPRTAMALVRISERTAKLTGIDAPTRLEQSGPGGGPVQVEQGAAGPDLTGLTDEELRQFAAISRKINGKG